MATKIESLQLDNFLCFAGDGTPAPIVFAGKNLLVYGENGSGKTAICRALQGLLALERPNYDPVNVFAPELPWSVKLKLTDGREAVWDETRHPATPGAGYDEEINRTGRRSACLSYSSLAGATAKNIFDLAVNSILRDYPVPVDGKVRQLRQLYQSLWRAVPKRTTASAMRALESAREKFNAGAQSALSQLEPQTGAVLADLAAVGAEVGGFNFPGVTYRDGTRKERGIGSERLEPRFRYCNHAPALAASFFNEARLTALALAIFLGGRLACTPANEDVLKVLVLDDVLISLDRGHRLPLLALLCERFRDWQVVLLTHDRVWHDIARDHLPKSDWRCIEVFPQDGTPPLGRPVVTVVGTDRVAEALRQASAFAKANQLPAAASYARVALELKLRKLCEKNRLPVAYYRHGVTVQPLVDAVREKAGEALAPVLVFGRVVLNEGSHADGDLERAEVEGAITALEKFAKFHPPKA